MKFRRVCIYRLGLYNRDRVARACAFMLREGKFGVIPTDTIYGFSADYFSVGARSLIMGLKGRSSSKGFIVLVPSVLALEEFSCQEIPGEVKALLPAPLTLIVRNRHFSLYGEDTIGIRVPDYSFIRDILVYMGEGSALVSTSFNYGGGDILDAIVSGYGDKIDFFVFDREPGVVSKASTILDITDKPYKVLRQGSYELPSSIFV